MDCNTIPSPAKTPTLIITALTKPVMKVFTAASIVQVEKEVNSIYYYSKALCIGVLFSFEPFDTVYVR